MMYNSLSAKIFKICNDFRLKRLKEKMLDSLTRYIFSFLTKINNHSYTPNIYILFTFYKKNKALVCLEMYK